MYVWIVVIYKYIKLFSNVKLLKQGSVFASHGFISIVNVLIKLKKIS